MFFWGFLVAVILEGFLLISGKTFFTMVLGWKNPPKPIARALDVGRARLIKVLGASEEILSSDDLMSSFSELSESDKQKVKEFICK